MHGQNAAEVILKGDLERKHPKFPVSILKHYKQVDKEEFPEGKIPKEVPLQIEKHEEKRIQRILDSKIIRKNGKDVRIFLCRFRGRHADQDEWRLPGEIPDADKVFRSIRAS